nr:hypothetical protein [Tanacetum cinerariifolium]
MAQLQRPINVHQDELCPPNKHYALMDANKKIDLDNPPYPNESKIMANILQNHPLRFSVAASSSVPWIYLGQFWHSLQEDRSKARDKYHNLEDDVMVKNIFNLVKHKDGVGMKILKDDYELRRREIGKHVEESRSTRSPTIIRSLKTYSTLISLDTKELQEFTVTNPPPSSLTPSSSSPKLKLSATNRILSLFKPKPGRFKQYKNLFYELKGRYEQQQQQLYLTMRDNPQLQQDDLPILLALKYKFKRLHAATTPCRPFVICPRDQDNPHDDVHPEGKNSAKRQKTKEIIFTPHPQRPTPVVQSYQRDPKAPALSLVNQDILYLKKGSSEPEKIMMSLHKFYAVIFSDN